MNEISYLKNIVVYKFNKYKKVYHKNTHLKLSRLKMKLFY